MKTDTGKQNTDSPRDAPDPIEELLATAYPNPDRVGCPGSSVIEALGNQKISKTDPVWSHVWHCSPCFREFKVVRDARWQREEAQALQRKRIRLAVVVSAAVLMIASVLLVLRNKDNSLREQQELAGKPQHSNLAITKKTDAHTDNNAPAQVDFVTLNLLNVGTYRGSEDHPVDLPLLHRKMVEMRITLPRFSDTGRYTIMVLKSRDSDSAIAQGSAVTTENDTVAEVKVRLNLSDAIPGAYLLATRRQGDQAMYYYPLRIIN